MNEKMIMYALSNVIVILFYKKMEAFFWHLAKKYNAIVSER